jgi:preprotein translocase subunit YajC
MKYFYGGIVVLMFITEAFAQAQNAAQGQPQQGGSLLTGFIVPMLAMIVIFYFILIRPQQKKEKERKQLLESIQKGDKVLTVAGIYGVVVSVKPEENIVVLKIADNTKVEFAKSAIQAKVS